MSLPRAVTPVRAIKVRPDRQVELPEHLVTEEPMQIQVAGPGQQPAPLAVTMRTPGHDFELAAGFVVSEGVADRRDLSSVGYCDAPDLDPAQRFNTVTVRLTHPWAATTPARQFVSSASCGVCGKTTIDELELGCPAVPVRGDPFPASVISGLPEQLRQAQPVFERTGGLHAAGLFDGQGRLLCVREDVGRHNAVDKVVGQTVLVPPALDLASAGLVVSGRVSFEIVQKAAVAGVGTIVAVSAPSSLAVTAGERLGVTLAAFVRASSFNIYTHPERILLDA